MFYLTHSLGVETLEENLSITTVLYDLVIATHGKEMHNQIILIVNQRVSVVNYPKTTAKNLQLTTKIICLRIFLPRVTMAKPK